MRSLLTAITVMAIASPAGAMNAVDRKDVDTFCLNAPTDDVGICYLRHLPEGEAFNHAGQLLQLCKTVDESKSSILSERYRQVCPKFRAYIKQRWGY